MACGSCGGGTGAVTFQPVLPFPNPIDAVRLGCWKCILGWILIALGLVLFFVFRV
jgi:hypothetical protein